MLRRPILRSGERAVGLVSKAGVGQRRLEPQARGGGRGWRSQEGTGILFSNREPSELLPRKRHEIRDLENFQCFAVLQSKSWREEEEEGGGGRRRGGRTQEGGQQSWRGEGASQTGRAVDVRRR